MNETAFVDACGACGGNANKSRLSLHRSHSPREMDAYARVKVGKLNLKGHPDPPRKRKRSSKANVPDTKVAKDDFTKDLAAHDGWWIISKFSDVIGPVAVQLTRPQGESEKGSDDKALLCPAYYLFATDDGFIDLGPPRKEGEPPAPEEIFTAVKVSDTKVAFKTGYGKYLTTDTNAGGVVTAAADAVGPREQFEPVFQDNQSALLGFNNCFLSVDPTNDRAVCRASKAGPTEMLAIRCNRELSHDPLMDMPEEERSGVRKAEYNYVRKFQSWQDKKIRLTREDAHALKSAKTEGRLHECMLDRREKMKSDRYCK
nr:unnamed protein product [Spirometra erinaceieuropaei]